MIFHILLNEIDCGTLPTQPTLPSQPKHKRKKKPKTDNKKKKRDFFFLIFFSVICLGFFLVQDAFVGEGDKFVTITSIELVLELDPGRRGNKHKKRKDNSKDKKCKRKGGREKKKKEKKKPVETKGMKKSRQRLHHHQHSERQRSPDSERNKNEQHTSIGQTSSHDLLPEHSGQLRVSQRQGPQTQIRGGVRDSSQNILNGVNNLVNKDFLEFEFFLLFLFLKNTTLLKEFRRGKKERKT